MMLTYRTWLWGVYACVNLLYIYDHDFLNDHVCLFCPLRSPLSLLTSLTEQAWKAQGLPFTSHSGLLPPPQLIFVQIPSPLALTLVCKALLSISTSLVSSSCSASFLLSWSLMPSSRPNFLSACLRCSSLVEDNPGLCGEGSSCVWSTPV